MIPSVAFRHKSDFRHDILDLGTNGRSLYENVSARERHILQSGVAAHPAAIVFNRDNTRRKISFDLHPVFRFVAAPFLLAL